MKGRFHIPHILKLLITTLTIIISSRASETGGREDGKGERLGHQICQEGIKNLDNKRDLLIRNWPMHVI